MFDAVVSPVRIGRSSVGALGILALALGALQSVVEPALPLLQRELGISPAEGALVANAFALTGAVIAPVAGKLGDRYGGKRVLIWLVAVISAGGLLSSLAPTLPVLLLGQVLQGGMVGALPLSFILVRKHLSSGESQAAVGLVVALFTGGGMVGTVVAGPIADGLSWHWMFALPTAAVIVTTVVVVRLMPHDPPTGSDSGIDWLGVGLLSATLLAFMVGLGVLTSGGLPPLAMVAVVLVVAACTTAWILVERRSATPTVDLRMLAVPATRNAYVLTFLVATGFGMIAILLPQLFAVSGDGYGFAADTTRIGLYLLPGALIGVVSDSVGGIASRRFGPRAVVVVGAAVTAVTMCALALLHDAVWQLVLARVLTAFAVGLATTALLAGAAASVETKDIGIATSLLVVTRVIGAALGTQLGGGVLALGTDPVTGLPTESAFAAAFVVTGLIAALPLLVVRITRSSVPR
ncbi:MFS transporter [Umezawaea tangerina]|uniref:MFS transporter n=1 Tax=Umezawaea tangerina TaxID=84725 RepID=A0A2T0T704_9PSEU|nr:MFS transporter [Umezawaea tangerina]PRY41421.1 MFS transporter [Umezawaea tangerina]